MLDIRDHPEVCSEPQLLASCIPWTLAWPHFHGVCRAEAFFDANQGDAWNSPLPLSRSGACFMPFWHVVQLGKLQNYPPKRAFLWCKPSSWG